MMRQVQRLQFHALDARALIGVLGDWYAAYHLANALPSQHSYAHSGMGATSLCLATNADSATHRSQLR